MGSGTDPHAEQSVLLGRWLAARGVHLLTGGGGGVMSAVSEAFAEVPHREGRVIGVLPASADLVSSPEGYPNPFVEIVLRTHLAARGEEGTAFDSRNHINVLSSDGIVILPGSAGTRSEAELALRYDRPAIVWAPHTDASTFAGMALPRAGSFADVQAFIGRVVDTVGGAS